MDTLLTISPSSILSLDDWMQNPLPHTEWVNGELIQKNGMTLKHSQIQARLAQQWLNFINAKQDGGAVYTDVPCRTHKQGRSSDVAYLTPDLVRQYGQEKVLPQSFPLCAEIVSPTDLAEEVIAKAQEYLASGAKEVWLLFPENQWVIVLTHQIKVILTLGETVKTQTVLEGFQITVDGLLN